MLLLSSNLPYKMEKEKKTNFKGIIYAFLGIILILIFFIGYKLDRLSKNNSLENEILLQKINQLTINYKRDSIEFVKTNGNPSTKMKQEFKDSVLNDLAINYSKEVETIKKEVKKLPTVTKQKKKKKIQQTKSKHSSNVTTYTKLPNYKADKSHTSNVTTYTKLNNSSNTNEFSSEVTTNSETITSNTPTTNIPKSNTSKSAKYTSNSQKKSDKIQHGIPELDDAFNINNVEFSPIYPGCKSKTSEKDRKNCLNTKITRFVYGKFNLSAVKNLNLNKGLNELRVLFVIGVNGKSKGIKTVGKWHSDVIKEAKRVISTLPKMTPGKKGGQPVAVKYSIKVPFIVE